MLNNCKDKGEKLGRRCLESPSHRRGVHETYVGRGSMRGNHE